MTGLDDFKQAYRAGKLVFLAGAGVSYDSGAPMPDAFLKASSEPFLPTRADFTDYRQKVTAGSSIKESEFGGIQPEVFYEQILSLHPGLEALSIWKALSPSWLASKRVETRPNPNHMGLVRYAER